MESLQVRKYQQTIIQATLVDEMDQLIIFLEELIKRLKGDKTAEDLYAFQQLSDQDQERVNELLVKVGLGYSSKAQSGYGKGGKDDAYTMYPPTPKAMAEGVMTSPTLPAQFLPPPAPSALNPGYHPDRYGAHEQQR